METIYGLLKIGCVFGVALGLMAYELMSVRKSIRADKKNDSTETTNGARSPADV